MSYCRKALGILVLLVMARGVIAASLQVSPTSIFIAAERTASGLTLSNGGTQPLHAQVRVFLWSQANGEERLEATTDVAISPPMLELPPGAQQLVRVIRLTPPPADVEQSYRIIVDELPEGRAAVEGQGLQFVLRYSIPVFLSPLNPAISPLLHTTLSYENGETFLEVGNQGNGHAQLSDLALVRADNRQLIAPGLSGYVLPGQRRRWLLPADMELNGDGDFKARITAELVERTLAPVATLR